MKNSTFAYLMVLGLALHSAPLASGQDGFTLPNLNPFKSKTDDSRDDEKRAGGLRLTPSLPKPTLPSLPTLSVPKFELPSFSTAKASSKPSTRLGSRRSEPSVWSRFNRSSKAFFAKTKSTLMPWANQSTKPGGRRVASRPRKSSFMSNLFGSEPPADEIDSVNEWLALPREQPFD